MKSDDWFVLLMIILIIGAMLVLMFKIGETNGIKIGRQQIILQYNLK
jgi:hypothetical protein